MCKSIRDEPIAPLAVNCYSLCILVAIILWSACDSKPPESPALQPDYRGVWNNLGNNAYRQQKYYQAIAFYQKELETSAAAIPYRGMGRAYVELGKVDSAQYAFEQAIAADWEWCMPFPAASKRRNMPGARC